MAAAVLVLEQQDQFGNFGRDKLDRLLAEGERSIEQEETFDQRILEAAILSRLRDQPTTPSKAIKRLRSNPFAEFELRAGDLRALYNVEGDEVVVLLVGRKVGNKLIVEGEEFYGHQDNSPEPPRNGPPAGAK